MAIPTLHSTPLSTYGRTCRMAFMEKGVDYKLDPASPQSAEQLQRQPWGSVPAMTHGEIEIYESLAICHYIDLAFDGPDLQPSDSLGRARCSQWTSVFIQYLYRPGVDIVLQRLIVPMQGHNPDEALVSASVPKTSKALGILDRALSGRSYFVGVSPSLCDYFVLPLITYLQMTPEGGELMSGAVNLRRWESEMNGRESAKATVPPLS